MEVIYQFTLVMASIVETSLFCHSECGEESVKSVTIRNRRTYLGCDEALFKTVVKTGFNQRRKTLRNSLKPLIRAKAERCGWTEDQLTEFVSDPIFEMRPERLSVEDFINLTLKLS